MITAQDVREVVFTKSLGGYKTGEVDAFLDQCAAALDALASENEANLRKMQVLAETVVEYRKQEESISSAMLSAQRTADALMKEAQDQAASILAEAEEKVKAIMEQADKDAANAQEIANQAIAAERAELARVRKEVSTFKARLMATYREHLTLIGVLEEEAPVAAEEASPIAPEAMPEQTEAAPERELDLSGFELKDDEE